jgi:hypothetical protein
MESRGLNPDSLYARRIEFTIGTGDARSDPNRKFLPEKLSAPFAAASDTALEDIKNIAARMAEQAGLELTDLLNGAVYRLCQRGRGSIGEQGATEAPILRRRRATRCTAGVCRCRYLEL